MIALALVLAASGAGLTFAAVTKNWPWVALCLSLTVGSATFLVAAFLNRQEATRAGSPRALPERVHFIADGSNVTSCCSRTPFELPLKDRMTGDPRTASCHRVGPS